MLALRTCGFAFKPARIASAASVSLNATAEIELLATTSLSDARSAIKLRRKLSS
jgi:hypothetical protein